MSPGNDERRPRQGGETSSSGANHFQNRAARRQKPAATPVIAHAYGVIGGTGRHRWLLLFKCPCCGQQHVAHGRGELPGVLERPAACGRGRLGIITVTVQRTGAA